MTGGERDGEWTQVFLASLSSGRPTRRRGNSVGVVVICRRFLCILGVKVCFIHFYNIILDDYYTKTFSLRVNKKSFLRPFSCCCYSLVSHFCIFLFVFFKNYIYIFHCCYMFSLSSKFHLFLNTFTFTT